VCWGGYLGPRKRNDSENWVKNCIMRIALLTKYYFGNQIQEDKKRLDMWHILGRIEVHAGFWGDVKEINPLKDLSVDGRIILKWIFMKWDGRMWTED
jgi:hypothetical protein